ncbi:MAG: ABC transporter permease [Candidatus Omnitrophica bacterium]|nr:ABC transporter permease [Candidatus Omnitrophota bacterium]MBU1869952.1 ABC transporter permease [Candidatus Omnitrophota bacterium]
MINSRGILFSHSLATMNEAAVGFLLGSAIGVILAVGFFYFKSLEKILSPYVFLTQIFPKISLAPILLIWLGFGMLPKVVISALMSLFPVMVNMLTGLRSTPTIRVDLFNSLFASKWQFFLKLYFPNSLIFLFPGLKSAILLAIVGAIVGEFVSATFGLGYLIQVSSYQTNINLCFGAIIALLIITILFYFVVEMFEYFILRWQRLECVNERRM